MCMYVYVLCIHMNIIEITNALSWATSVSQFCAYLRIHLLLKKVLIIHQYAINEEVYRSALVFLKNLNM